MWLKSLKVSTKGMPLNSFPGHALQGAAVSSSSTVPVVLASPSVLTSPPKVICPLHCLDFSPSSSGSSRGHFSKGSYSFSLLLMLTAATPKGFSSAGIPGSQGGTNNVVELHYVIAASVKCSAYVHTLKWLNCIHADLRLVNSAA